ncbi:MAG: hypothetical protein DLM67_25170 [Candidatus Nephthysia bennettiae]|nr:MAG: hypothetical protein DLM67_25170 [Candidatus Dormibacteraeota bacterium]
MTSRHEDEEGSVGVDGDRRSSYALGRLLAFSDGVFAIAITILVLSIPVPNLPPRQAAQHLAEALYAQGENLLGFGLSFVLVASFWVIHHRLLRDLARPDAALYWLNFLFLGFVCLLPFSAGVLIRYGSTTIATQLYAANLLLCSLSSNFIGVYLVRRPRLLSPGVLYPRVRLLRGLAAAAVFAVSIPLAFLNADAAKFFWLFTMVVARLPFLRRGGNN